MSLRPKEVEEERSPKDGGNSNPDEDIVRRRSDKVVVADRSARMQLLDGGLLINVVYKKRQVSGVDPTEQVSLWQNHT